MKKYLLPFLLFLAGVFLLLYPRICDLRHDRVSLDSIAVYDAAAARLSQKEKTEILASEDPALLCIGGGSMIGYISIPKIQVLLPIYADTSTEHLLLGAGVLEGSDLPLGAPGAHSVLSSHRGLPEARLFTDLDQLEPGDRFTVTVLDQEHSYEVDSILVVRPDDLSALAPEEGQSLCTLLTCTPYGINSHRLLIRGHLI